MINFKDKSLSSLGIAFIISFYFLVYGYTVLSRDTGNYLIEFYPLGCYRDLFIYHYKMQIIWITINICMLIPVGYVLPAIFENITLKQLLLIGLILAYTIEFSQLLFHKGVFELFDDPINNALGCLIGFYLYKCIKRKR